MMDKAKILALRHVASTHGYALLAEAADAIESLQAKVAELEKDGYVLAPKEPTNEMIDAASALEDFKYSHADVYRAMIAAMPNESNR